MILFPKTYWTTYTELGQRYFAVWRQWFGRVYDHTRIPVAGK